MITDTKTFIEHYGKQIIDAETFIEHYGKKGMQWGKRGTARAQKHIDSLHKISTGTQTGRDRLRVGVLVTKKGATKALGKGASLQSRVSHGEKKVTNMLVNMHGIKIKNLDFHGVKGKDYKRSGTNKGDAGRKVVQGLLVTGALATTITSLVR